MHNSYLYLAVKMCIMEFASFMLFFLAFLTMVWLDFKKLAAADFSRIPIAVLASRGGPFVWAITHISYEPVDSTSV